MIIVFGSINMDMIMPVGHFPAPGETVLGEAYRMSPGGKGANQALAAARAGAEKVTLAGRVGDDGMGLRMINGLRRDGVMTSGVAQSDLPTGMAVIITTPDGENQIIVAPGANNAITHDQIPDEILKEKTYVLLQCETPAEQNLSLLERAKKRGAKTVLNLSPFTPLSLAHVDILILNEIEAQQLARSLKIDATLKPESLACAISKQKNLTCVITIGAKGSATASKDGRLIFTPALPLEHVVDCTGAGDAFCGTLTAALYNGTSLEHALRMAAVAGSLACLKQGTQESYVYLGDIQENLPLLGDSKIEKL